MKKTLVLLALGAGLSMGAYAEAPKVMNGYLVDEGGYTLYTFDNDTMPGQSSCTGGCAVNWLPAMADAYDKASGNLSVIKYVDGKPLWAYKGHPLYRFAKDAKPGEVNGDGKGGVWHVVKP